MISKSEQAKVWNTSTLKSFNHDAYDNILFTENIEGAETYIKLPDVKTDSGRKIKEGAHVEGFEVIKQHRGSSVHTTYFVRTEDAKNMPLKINNTVKHHYARKVYNLVTSSISIKIRPEKKMSFKILVDISGQPIHTNQTHYTLYKMKVLYGRLGGQFYYRVVSESAFGKTKYKEMIKLLLNDSSIISDPTAPKLYYQVCYKNDITINELPDDSNKTGFIKFCNMLMNIGDKSQGVENPARSMNGSMEEADTSKTSVSFTHNIPSYYHDKGLRSFDEIYPFNVYSRYYPNLYEGMTVFEEVHGYDPDKTAKEYKGFLIDWIKTALWYEENGFPINKYGTAYLDTFEFASNTPRFKEHFYDFARVISEYSESEQEYRMLVKAEYDSHKAYENLPRLNQEQLKW